jgi:hypothetical protein
MLKIPIPNVKKLPNTTPVLDSHSRTAPSSPKFHMRQDQKAKDQPTKPITIMHSLDSLIGGIALYRHSDENKLKQNESY